MAATGAPTVTSSYYLDSLLRSTSWTGTSGATYTYDGAGALLTTKESTSALVSSTQEYAVNDAELPSYMTMDVAGGGHSTWSYDQAGRVTSQGFANSTTATIGYDANNEETSSVMTNPSSTLASWGYTYLGGLVSSQSFSGASAGTGHTAVQNTFQYGYDGDGRVVSFTNGAASAEAVTWDHNGNRLSNAIPNSVGVSQTSVTYQADNSILTATPSTGTPATYSYDGEGRLVDDGCSTYAYDARDLVTAVAGKNLAATCAAPNSASVSYTYDPLSRQRTTTSGGTTTTLYDVGLSTTVADESTGSTPTWYQLTPSLQPIAVHKGSTTQYLVDDGRGSVGTVVDSGGTAQCTVRYDPFGQPVGALSSTPQALDNCNSVGTAPLSDVWYHGQRQDGTTGDYQFGPRTYDPAKGTFLTPDSYSFGTGATNPSVGTDPLTANTYTYVNGDPVNLMDPNGHGPCLGDRSNTCLPPHFTPDDLKAAIAAAALDDANDSETAALPAQVAAEYLNAPRRGHHLRHANRSACMRSCVSLIHTATDV